jgi:CRP-like cAMP-binding protein
MNIEAHLSRIALFSDLAPEHLALIARATREVRCLKGETLFYRGDPCSGFHIVVYGQIKLSFTSPQGTEKVVEIVDQGRSFGEAIMFLDKPYVVSAQALSDSLLLHVPKTVVFAELEQNHEFSRRMLGGLAWRTRQLLLDVEGYSLHSGKQRVIGYLLDEIPKSGQGETSVVVHLPVTKGVIASRLNLTQEHFSRILHELIELGLIVVDGKRIGIPNIARLQAELEAE